MDSEEFELTGLEETIARVGRDRSQAIAPLQALQSEQPYGQKKSAGTQIRSSVMYEIRGRARFRSIRPSSFAAW